MCGIGGIVHASPDRPVPETDLAWMRDRLRHRGPDASGIHSEGSWGVCHTRLAVLDLSPRAHQPMLSASGRYCLTYNGEIYNYLELREQLERMGARFRSESDTEVILQLVEHEGIDALNRIEGMFALGLYDRERKELLLLRDRCGIKPLFWARNEGGVAFASEPKALSRFGRGGAPSAAQVAEYLAFRHLARRETLDPGIETLLPGHRLRTDGRQLQVERWWDAEDVSAPTDPGVTAHVVRGATRRQLVSDVPVGVFLSGGVDSALVADAAHSELGTLDAFTVGFEESAWDETARARTVSRALGLRTHAFRVGEDEYVRELGRAIWHLDAPLNHAHSVHLLLLSRFARRHITVALTGEGSDELFAGYPRYRLFLIAHALRPLAPARARRHLVSLRRIWPRGARLIEAAASEGARAAAINAAFVPVDEAARLAGLQDPDAALSGRMEVVEGALLRERSPLRSLLDLERSTYLVSLLQRMDRMSMAVGLECRVPLLDEAMVKHSLGLPQRALIGPFDSKKPMRTAAERRFGRAHARAPKSGFGVPLDAWFRGDGSMGKLLGRILDEPRTRERGWLDVSSARTLYAQHRSGVADHAEELWGVLNLELWARIGLEGDDPDGITANR